MWVAPAPAWPARAPGVPLRRPPGEGAGRRPSALACFHGFSSGRVGEVLGLALSGSGETGRACVKVDLYVYMYKIQVWTDENDTLSLA